METDNYNEKLELFREVIEILNNSEITYWIDQGSLLGLIRDNKFLSWDKDVDIGIWKEDAKKLENVLNEQLIVKGARISFLPYAIKIKKKYNVAIQNVPVNIRLYNQENDYAYSEFWSVINKNKWFKRNLDRVLIGLYTRAGKKMSETANSSNWINRTLKYKIYKVFFDFFLGVREMFKTRQVIFRVDTKFFCCFKSINLYGLDLPVPEESEKYLSVKYGSEWKVPVKNWEWWKDDGALYKTSYHFLNLRGLFYKFYR